MPKNCLKKTDKKIRRCFSSPVRNFFYIIIAAGAWGTALPLIYCSVNEISIQACQNYILAALTVSLFAGCLIGTLECAYFVLCDSSDYDFIEGANRGAVISMTRNANNTNNTNDINNNLNNSNSNSNNLIPPSTITAADVLVPMGTSDPTIFILPPLPIISRLNPLNNGRSNSDPSTSHGAVNRGELTPNSLSASELENKPFELHSPSNARQGDNEEPAEPVALSMLRESEMNKDSTNHERESFIDKSKCKPKSNV